MTNQPTQIQWIIFDLGGVLIELDGPPISPQQTNLTEPEIWQTWLESEAVRKYESGRCDGHEFATALISEFQLTCSQDQLLLNFGQWPLGFFPEAENLVDSLRGKIKLACLSNTNELHWQRFSGESPIFGWFDRVFLSFEMGLMKPDETIFIATQDQLDTTPEQVLFLDDNQANVDAALAFGWQSSKVKGIHDVTRCLKSYALL